LQSEKAHFAKQFVPDKKWSHGWVNVRRKAARVKLLVASKRPNHGGRANAMVHQMHHLRDAASSTATAIRHVSPGNSAAKRA
jgi:hypothetical protein